MECEYKRGEYCLIASRLAGADATVLVHLCESCVRQPEPKAENKATMALAFMTAHRLQLLDKANELTHRSVPTWQCPQCGLVAEKATKPPILCQCGYVDNHPTFIQQDQAPPGILRRAVAYGRAVINWKLAGSPTRTDEEVRKILDICNTCPKFTAKYCLTCGCHINDRQGALFNKARMGTEQCPEGFWT